VTVFTQGALVCGRPTDVSVLVQRKDSGDPVLDAEVHLRFTLGTSLASEVCGAPRASPLQTEATREQASNRWMYAALPEFGTAGQWHLNVLVSRHGERTALACDLPVDPPPRGLAGIWPYLLMPPVLAALYGANRTLARSQSRCTRPS
jgi:hypothetical protein